MKTPKVLVDHHMRAVACPCCRTILDGALGTTGINAPKPGDLSVCIRCASPLVFDSDLGLKLLTDKDIEGMHPIERHHLKHAIFMASEALLSVEGRRPH